MSEDSKQKEIRLRKELAKVKAQNASESRKITKNRDFSVGGIPPDTTHKRTNTSNDVPDAILLPSKRRGKKENIPFWGDSKWCIVLFLKAQMTAYLLCYL